jgi:hypothetical protein
MPDQKHPCPVKKPAALPNVLSGKQAHLPLAFEGEVFGDVRGTEFGRGSFIFAEAESNESLDGSDKSPHIYEACFEKIFERKIVGEFNLKIIRGMQSVLVVPGMTCPVHDRTAPIEKTVAIKKKGV